jgi:phenylacetate-CoA ligase
MKRTTELREVSAFGLELVQAYRRNRAPRSTIRELQERRLRDVLEAASKTRLYGGRPLRFLDDAQPLKKSVLQEHLDDSVTIPGLTRSRMLQFVFGGGQPGMPLDDRFLVATTSGTTGHVGIFVNDVEGWARQRAVVFARVFAGMLKPEGFALLARRKYRLAFVIATGGHWLTSILASRVPSAGKLVMETHTSSIDWPLSRIVDELNTFQPLLLHTYPTFLEVLAAEARRGALRITPELLTVGSESVSTSCRDAVREAFPKSKLVETYAATECVSMATSCEHGTLHINEDACVLEPVDDQLRPVPFGRRADRVLVTNLLNTVQPLLRYELTDSVVVDDQPCRCGSPFLRLQVHGRTDDTFFLIDDKGRAQSHPPIPIETAFLGIGGLLQYQLVHEEQNRLRLAFVVDHNAKPADVAQRLDDRLSRYLDEHGLGQTVSYVVEQVDAVERHSRSKKLRQITSRVAKPNGPVVSSNEARKK